MGTSTASDQVPSAFGVNVNVESSSNVFTCAAMLAGPAGSPTTDTTTFGKPAVSPGTGRHPVPLKVTVLPATTGFGVTVNVGGAAAAGPANVTSGAAASTAMATRL